jgi:hypothetical protein
MTAGCTRLTLELAQGDDAMRGTLVDSKGRARTFQGWLELMIALEEAGGTQARDTSMAAGVPKDGRRES